MFGRLLVDRCALRATGLLFSIRKPYSPKKLQNLKARRYSRCPPLTQATPTTWSREDSMSHRRTKPLASVMVSFALFLLAIARRERNLDCLHSDHLPFAIAR